MESKERLIIQSAKTVFAKFGYRKAALDDIAKEAGISRSSIYLYFKDKKEVYTRTLKCVMDRAHENLKAEMEASPKEFSSRFFKLLSYVYNEMYGPSELQRLMLDTGEANGIASTLRQQSESRVCTLLEKELTDLSTLGLVQFPEGISSQELANLLCYGAKGIADKSGEQPIFEEHLGNYLNLISMAISKAH